MLDKSIRIASFVGLFSVFSILLGAIRSALDDKNMTFDKYMKANVGNVLTYAFYFTLQDTSFIVATVFLKPSFDSKMNIIGFGVGVFLAAMIIIFLFWCYNLINYPE